VLSASPKLRRLSRSLAWPIACVGLIGLSVAASRYAASISRVPGTLRDRLHLGGCLADGRHPTKDHVGLWVHDLACRAGDARGCTHVGRVYDEGWGVAVDKHRAMALYDRACADGDGLGCANLGLSYEIGDGVPIHLPMAVALYEKGCAFGEEYACYRLAICHDLGNGVPADPVRALSLYALACEGGSPKACTDMGAYHELRDGPTAAAYYRRACSDGEAAACEGLRRVYAAGP
jgi:TPR repeat protein